MAQQLAIHVVPDSNPDNVVNTLRLLNRVEVNFESVKQFVEYIREEDSTASEWVHSTARAMGLLEHGPEGITISALGRTLTQIRDEIQGDLLHFLLYTGWSEEQPIQFLQSWGYRQACDIYWSRGQFTFSSALLNTIVSDIIAIAETSFSQITNLDHERVSFSTKSLTGVRKWLEALQPAVITETGFERRHFCPPELLILGLDYIVRDDDQTTDLEILLTPEKREILSRLCLMEPDSLDASLDWALAAFGHIASPGTGAGFYGRFVRLHKRPTFGDLIR